MSRSVICGIVALFFCASAYAHPEGFSGLRILLYRDSAKAVLTLHTRDMSAWFPPGKYTNYVPDICRAIIADPSELLDVQLDGQTTAPSDKKSFSPEVGMIEVDLTFPIAQMPAQMTVWSKHLVRLPRGHQQLLFVEDMRAHPELAGGSSIYEGMLTVDIDSAAVDIPAAPSLGNIASTQPAVAATPPISRPQINWFRLGVSHILTGYDHLLFLAAVLLVCRNFKEAASVVTFFTVAHSITLTLSALDIVRIPPRLVEPAVAASIAYMGMENIFGTHRVLWRAMITFGFGLVHGLAFASDMRAMGLGSTPLGVALPLLKFSVGIESTQLCIAAILLKVLLTARQVSIWERRWVPACSLLISLIGGYWLVTRVIAS